MRLVRGKHKEWYGNHCWCVVSFAASCFATRRKWMYKCKHFHSSRINSTNFLISYKVSLTIVRANSFQLLSVPNQLLNKFYLTCADVKCLCQPTSLRTPPKYFFKKLFSDDLPSVCQVSASTCNSLHLLFWSNC